MAVDFSIQNVISVIAQVLCGGDMTVAGLLIMIAVFFASLTVLAMVRAPVTYSLVPLIPIAILFAAMNILDVTVSFVIIIITALIVGNEVRKTVNGG